MSRCSDGNCGSHDHGGHDHSHSHDVEDPSGISLFGLIDTTRVRCLNESQLGSVLNCIKPWSERLDTAAYVESNEDDPELIIFVPFTQIVKVKAISILGGREGTAPSALSVWVNREDVDFQTAESIPPVQKIDMVESIDVEINYPTKVNKMQHVSNVTLYFKENFGAPTTIIRFLGFRGESTNIRHGIVETVYESKPQAADHKQKTDEFQNRSIL